VGEFEETSEWQIRVREVGMEGGERRVGVGSGAASFEERGEGRGGESYFCPPSSSLSLCSQGVFNRISLLLAAVVLLGGPGGHGGQEEVR